MRADRREALLDFLLMAVSDEGTTPFPADLLAGLRRVARCEAVSHWEWSAHELLESSLAADDPESSLRVWGAYPQVRQDDPLPGWAPRGSPLPHREWLGQTFAISDFISDRQFRRGGLYAEICKPLGVRAVMKVFLPTGSSRDLHPGASGHRKHGPGSPKSAQTVAEPASQRVNLRGIDRRAR